MKKLLIALAIAAFGCSPTTVEDVRSPIVTVEKPKAEEKKAVAKKVTIDWQPFSQDLLKVSLALNKPVFIYIKDDKCGYCKKMMRGPLSNPIIVNAINKRYIPTILDARKNPKTASMFYKGEKRISVPKFVFIQQNDHGRFVLAQAGGYLDVFQMIKTMETADEFIKKKILETNANNKVSGEHKSLPTK